MSVIEVERNTSDEPVGVRSSARVVSIIGALGLVGVVMTAWLGLFITPPDRYMGTLVRLLYVHPPMAWVAFLAYGVSFAASLAYLWPRTRSRLWDRLAGASAEVGIVFTGVTLATGSIWGRPTWGTWWTWDPLLTTTALLFVLYLGYLAIRRVPGAPEVQGKRNAIAALVAFVDVPVVYFSVYWWQSLHQAPSVLNISTRKTYVHGSMAWTLLLGFCSFTLVFIWLVVKRFQLASLESIEEDAGLAHAIVERRREGQQ